MNGRWRESCAPIIHKVLEETKGMGEKAIRKALKEAYPFGERAMHPYKVWLSEIKNERHLNNLKVIDNQMKLL